jgi:hypothetical protein
MLIRVGIDNLGHIGAGDMKKAGKSRPVIPKVSESQWFTTG